MNKDNSWTSMMWKKLKDMGWRRIFNVIKPSFSSFLASLIFITLVIFFPSQQWERMGNNLENTKNDTPVSSTVPAPSTNEPTVEITSSEVTSPDNITDQESSSPTETVDSPTGLVNNPDNNDSAAVITSTDTPREPVRQQPIESITSITTATENETQTGNNYVKENDFPVTSDTAIIDTPLDNQNDK